jgi:hypothetical protein
MFSAMLICAVCATVEPSDVVAAARVESDARAAYEAARADAGRNADAHVRLALWCEAHGMEAERLKHLAMAVLADPAHATARGLMGLVAFGGGWQSPEAVSVHVSSDATYAAALAEYNGRRARMADSADAHWKMALWCEQRGLKPEATAHLSRVVQLEPGRDAAWEHLGYRKHAGRWLTDEQFAAERAEALAQKEADRHWPPIFAQWRRWIGDKTREFELAEALATVTDSRAVPSVWEAFGRGKAAHQKAAVQILGQIDSPASTRALALLALQGKSPQVRATATQTLRLRDPREIAAFLIAWLRDPQLDADPIVFHYRLKPVAWGAFYTPGVLYVRGPRYDVLRTYTVDESWNALAGRTPVVVDGNFAERVDTQRKRQIQDLVALIDRIRRESVDDFAAAHEQSRQIDRVNARVIQLLTATIGQDLGKDREAWRKWWAEVRGYAYEPSPLQPRQDLTLDESKPTYYDNVHFSCFAAGTPVQTLTGPRLIESIAVGDQVLTQDPRSGALSYHPVVDAVHNKPDQLFKIDFGHGAIKATGIHRFWKAGYGWVMARALKPGDVVRALGGVATVKSVEQAGVQPVYNLKLLQAESFFVGSSGLLVHDNSEVQPVARPFDAAPELAALPSSAESRK